LTGSAAILTIAAATGAVRADCVHPTSRWLAEPVTQESAVNPRVKFAPAGEPQQPLAEHPAPAAPRPCPAGFRCGPARDSAPVPAPLPTFQRLDLLPGDAGTDCPRTSFTLFADPAGRYAFEPVVAIEHPPRSR
jgi:hypothetical protein